MTAKQAVFEKFKSMLEREKLGGLLVYSRSTTNILRPNYFRYITGVRAVGPHNAFLMSRAGKTAVLIQPEWDARRVARQGWVEEVLGTEDFTRDAAKLLSKLGIRGTVGLVGGNEMTLDLYDAIARKRTVADINDGFEDIALERDEEDHAIARRSCEIAEIGFQALLRACRVGARECELVAETEYAMIKEGADDCFILMSSGERNRAMHPPSDRRLAEGDVIILELTPVYQGHFSQLCRTIQIGRPNPVLADKMDMLKRAYEAGLGEVRVGGSVAGMCKAINKVISDAGYGEWCYPPHIRTRGHGFGVGSIKPGGVLDEQSKETFRAGQVLVVHPNQFVSEVGYLACGETVLVTETGCERLTDREGKSGLFAVEV